MEKCVMLSMEEYDNLISIKEKYLEKFKELAKKQREFDEQIFAPALILGHSCINEDALIIISKTATDLGYSIILSTRSTNDLGVKIPPIGEGEKKLKYTFV